MADNWKDNLFVGGLGFFRDVAFFVDSAESQFGRRTVLHEFPGSDHVEMEDLGRGTQKFTFNAYIISREMSSVHLAGGSGTYQDHRDRLIQALEMPGSGPLNHPYLGSMVVTIDGMTKIRETTAEGGMCRFTINVVRVRDLPPIKEDTASAVDTSATEALAALKDDLEDAWTVVGVIEAVRDAAQDLVDGVNGITSKLNKIKGTINAAMNVIDSVGDAITDLADMAADLILLPGQLVDSIGDLVSDITSVVGTIGDAFDSYFDDDEIAGDVAGTPAISPTGATPASGTQRAALLLKTFKESMTYGDGFSTVEETTPQREAEAANQLAMVTFFKGATIAETCRNAATMPFVSYDQAVDLRDALADELDALAEVANDQTYVALTNLRAAITKHLTNASAELPRVISHTPAKTLPALVIAQNLYADSTREADILDRNNVENPCFVPGGVALEVLSDV